jgi:hypothetical protein
MIKKINKKNKRGDVPVMILVIGVVMICVLTIFSFVAFKSSLDKASLESGIYLLEQAHSDLEIFHFYQKFYDDNTAAGEVGLINPAINIKAEISGNNLVINGKQDRVSFVWDVPINGNVR